ncbi:hypothetical protein, partial [Kaistella sp.]|uniref:hypothetical protein n=1 Tax=Kaistella sp. TaxID=2782235 RepID=UPI002F93F545
MKTTLSSFYKSLLAALLLFVSVAGWGQIMSWDGTTPTALTAYGPNPWTATSISTGVVNSTGITRGSSVLTAPTAAGSAWGGSGGWEISETPSTNNGSVVFSLTVSSGYNLSLSSISSATRRSMSGPSTCVIQYSINSGSYVSLGTWTTTSTSGSTGTTNTTSLSSVTALQGLAAGTIVNFRIVKFSSNTGSWYLIGSNALKIDGTITPVPTCAAPTVSSTVSVANNSTSGVDFSGSITNAGGGTNITERGFQYSTSV